MTNAIRLIVGTGKDPNRDSILEDAAHDTFWKFNPSSDFSICRRPVDWYCVPEVELIQDVCDRCIMECLYISYQFCLSQGVYRFHEQEEDP
jgi:hypothetical protein